MDARALPGVNGPENPRHLGRPTWSSRYTVAVLTAVLGTLATLGAFLLVSWWEYRVAEIDFESKAKTALQTLNSDLGDAQTLLYTIAAFMESRAQPVSAREFAFFSASLHRRVAGVRDTGFAPRIVQAQRAAFEREVRATGTPGFRVRQFGPHRELVTAGARPVYYPLRFIEAGGTKRALLGFDLISEPKRAAAAARALRTGRAAATPPMDVATVEERGAGILGYVPVTHVASVGGRQRISPRGLILGVFDIPVMVRNILAAENALAGLNLYLYNPTATPDRRFIYRTPGAARPPAIADLLAGAHVQTRTTFIDQSIPTIVTPAQPLTLIHWSLFATTTLIVGFTMTSMIAGYFVLSLRRTRELEALTEQLVATTAALNEQAAAITHVSRHDLLTGMPNRLLFGDRMRESIDAFEHGVPFTLLYLDLDRFKSVNDTLGHGAGDRLLCAVAERIAGCIRTCDTAARIGGDEFAIILPDMADAAFVEAVAARLIVSLSAPYTLDGQPASIGVSIGAAMATPGVSIESIMVQADVAMYEAKRHPASAFHLYTSDMRDRASYSGAGT